MQKNLLNYLHAIFDMLFGVQPFQQLPAAYYQQTDWSSATQNLQKPAAWRRQARIV